MSSDQPPNNESIAEANNAGFDSFVGRRIGIYRLEKRIGKGGMGAVYLATRDDGEFRQQVAVKLIKRGMDTDFILNRFRHERQILATLEHPFIARLLDGGTTDDGLPYFVMDFIKGESLIEFVEQNKLNLRERLELFRRVCEAVNFAHQKRIVHRDLKPTNILVTANRTPKLLDFGIAKLLNPEENEGETLMPTQTQMRLMTPEYAAPEQIRGETITPATDVYSLGVLLYEILTGTRPYKFPSRAPHEIARVVCEDEPRELTSVQLLKIESLSESAASKELNYGDLNNVILKSLNKNPAERYGNAKELSDDIERFLKNQKVSAEAYVSKIKISTEMNVAKSFSSRNQSIAVLPFKILASGNSENSEENEFLSIGLADALTMRLSNVNRFLVRPTSSVLPFGSPEIEPFFAGRELGVDFVIDGNIRRVGDRIRVAAQLLNVVENSTRWAQAFDEKYTDVLELEDSISDKVTKSLLPKLTGEEQRRLNKRGTNSHEAFEAYMQARFYWNQFTPESFPKTIAAFEKAVSIDPNYAQAHAGIADFYNWATIYGFFPSNESAPKVLAAANRALEIDSSLGEAYAALGLYYSGVFEHQKAEENYRRAVELAPNYSLAHEWLAATLTGTGRFAEGIKEIKIAEQLDPFSLRAKTLTAWTKYQAREFESAYQKGKEIVALDARYPQGWLQIGNAALELGFVKEAIEMCEKAIETMKPSPLPVYAYCFALARDGQTKKAKNIVEDLVEQSKSVYITPYFLGMAHVAVGEIDAAFEYFEKSFEENNQWLLWFGTEAKLDALRKDARYFNLLKKTDNPIIKTITPPEN